MEFIDKLFDTNNILEPSLIVDSIDHAILEKLERDGSKKEVEELFKTYEKKVRSQLLKGSFSFSHSKNIITKTKNELHENNPSVVTEYILYRSILSFLATFALLIVIDIAVFVLLFNMV